MLEDISKVLVYRLGSIGDTAVALPALHLIRKSFPNAQISLLNNKAVSEKTVAAQGLLAGSKLIDDYFSYPGGVRNISALLKLRQELRAWQPELLVFLGPARSFMSSVRYWLFFKSCGIKKIIGLPFSSYKRKHRYLEETELFESETCRLLRNISTLGTIDVDSIENWDLDFSKQEIREVKDRLLEEKIEEPFIAFCIGTKIPVKDWGDANWHKVFVELAEQLPNFALVAIGAQDDMGRSEKILDAWPGASLNLCGKTNPRLSALVLKQAKAFLGLDSGPMHLAAAVNTPCICVFSARDKPGLWFPKGNQHHIFYEMVSCMGCKLEVCTEYNTKCIKAIKAKDVAAAALTVITY